MFNKYMKMFNKQMERVDDPDGIKVMKHNNTCKTKTEH